MMDISETYIKMCEKAEEIQKPFVLDSRDYICVKSVKSIGAKALVGQIASPDVFNIIDEFIWLPRQDQLQEMVREHKPFAIRLVYRFNAWLLSLVKEDYFTNPHLNYESMEQLWLAFVMSEKFNKVWDGEQWTTTK